MNKLDKDLYIKHAKRLASIINKDSTFINFLTRPDFNAVIKNQLNVLSACEKLFPKIDIEAKYTSKQLVKKFNELTKDKFKIDEKFKYEDQTDLIDAINYLITFCNNMFKVNLDDLISGKKVTATDPKIDLRAKAEFDDQGPRMNSNFAFAGAGIPLATTPYENPYFVGKAYAKLTDDMKQGKFYRYKTKPRIVPIAKWICSVLMILLIAFLLITSICCFTTKDIKVVGADSAGDLIMNGVFYLITAAFGVYPLYVTMRSIVGERSKNQNTKYYFNWGFVLVFVILAFMMGIFDTVSLWMLQVETTTSATMQFRLLLVKSFLLTSMVIVGLIVIWMVIGAINNPKPDVDLVEKKIKEYIDMFSAESGSRPVPPKTDVQKPVDVKESKKDTKSKPKK